MNLFELQIKIFLAVFFKKQQLTGCCGNAFHRLGATALTNLLPPATITECDLLTFYHSVRCGAATGQ